MSNLILEIKLECFYQWRRQYQNLRLLNTYECKACDLQKSPVYPEDG